MNFFDCCKVYDDSDHLFEHGVEGCPVEFKELNSFDKARKRLSKLVTNDGLHGDWEEAIKFFGILHAKIARTPCRPSWLIYNMLGERGGKRIIEQVDARVDSVDPIVRESIAEAKDRLLDLSAIDLSPLVEPLLNLPDIGDKTLFILRDMRLWGEVHACLSEAISNRNWELVKPSSLRNPQRAGRVVMFGPLWYLAHRNEEYLLRSPAARSVHLIACAHEYTGQIRISSLDGSGHVPVNGIANYQADDTPWTYEPIPPANRGNLRFKESGESRLWESGKKVSAVPFRLGRGRGTYFGVESSVWVVKADCRGDYPVCSGVEKISVDEIDAGDMVLMTTSGGGDMIPVVADMILPDSRRIRELQRQWKAALRDQVETHGMDYVAIQLKARGAQMAVPANIRGWCDPKPRRIGMDKLDTDLRAVLQLVGMEERYDDVKSGIGFLRGAHQSAGSQLQKRLRESLEGMDLSEVFRQGEVEIKEGDGPAKTVFLVEERGEESEIPEEWEGELREVDD
jgi:hypothetical protein